MSRGASRDRVATGTRVLEMGGKDIASAAGREPPKQQCEGFWQGYRTLMGFNKDGF